MDIIERYLSSLRILLPAAQRDDIVAELRDVLTGRREERSAEVGRTLTLEEEEQLLRDFGHPVAVAARYRPQEYLIGPDLAALRAGYDFFQLSRHGDRDIDSASTSAH